MAAATEDETRTTVARRVKKNRPIRIDHVTVTVLEIVNGEVKFQIEGAAKVNGKSLTRPTTDD